MSSIVQRLTQRDLLKQYASVTEQILMSGSNMLASIVVIHVGNIAQFGIYSFVFVLGTLISGVFGTLLHRQMMLEIASAGETEQRRIFLSTVAIELVGLAIFLTVLAGTTSILSVLFDFDTHNRIVAAGAVYISLYVLFDAFKQYAYTIGNQIYSLRCTFIYVSVQVLLMGGLVLFYHGDWVVEAAYSILSIGLIASLLSNRLCLDSLRKSQWQSWKFSAGVLEGYFKQGRFSLLGMAITWAQNQSMNPFLMLISGPTVAGYFSLGRLLIMPMAVVSQGLVNSSTPTLRRIYKQKGIGDLPPTIRSFLLKTTLFSLLYVAVLLVGHYGGLLERVVPDYEQVQWYLLVWVILVSCSIARFWHGQFFVVSMEFQFLSRVSIASLIVTASGMLIFGVGFDSIRLALASVIAGEIIALILYQRKQASLLQTNQ